MNHDDPYNVAIHEAGHAVMALLLGGTEIFMTMGDGDPHAAYTEFALEVNDRVVYKRLITTVSGLVADEIHQGEPHWWSFLMLDDSEHGLPDLIRLRRREATTVNGRKCNAMAVARPAIAHARRTYEKPVWWAAVEALATALLHAGTLEHEAIKQTVWSAVEAAEGRAAA